MEHSFRIVPVVEAISKHSGLPVESMLLRAKHKSNYVAFAGEDAPDHFAWMNKFGTVPFDEISSDGFGDELTQVLDFPKDDMIAPMVMENLKEILAKLTDHMDVNEISRKNFQLKKIHVIPHSYDSKSVRVSAVEWLDTTSLKRHRMTVNHLFISLGPSGGVNVIPPQLTWWQHARDCLKKGNNLDYHPTKMYGGYTPTFPSLWRHSLNTIKETFFRGTQCLKDFGMAAGSTSVLMLGVDLEQTSKAQLDVFSRFLEGLNQHWTLIAQRDVTLFESKNEIAPIRHYRFFAIQMTGGGNFPSRFSKPDYLVNLLSSTEKIYGLNKLQHHGIYDIVQSRGCGRAVSAQNTVAFQHLANNAVISYALGGIGMTKMFSNGEKMVQMVEQQDNLLKEKADIAHGLIPNKNVLDGINYSYMVGDPYKVARTLGMFSLFFYFICQCQILQEKTLVNGGLAGAIDVTCVFPIDFIKTRMQNQKHIVGQQPLYKNMFDCAMKSLQRSTGSGFCQLYSGLAVNVLFITPEKSIKLVANDWFCHLLKNKNDSLRIHQQILAGAGAGTCQIIVTTPMELLKIRVQMIRKDTTNCSKNARHIALEILREKGIFGLYKGVSATYTRDVFFSMIFFPLFTYFNNMGKSKNPSNDESLVSFYHSPISGSAAGGIGAFCASPIDDRDASGMHHSKSNDTQNLSPEKQFVLFMSIAQLEIEQPNNPQAQQDP
ncbi:hypothetical protein I4U23_016861 [Adineta vaga]|nr:hypothetical protein I4U23_016861 [Adineta vaga]